MDAPQEHASEHRGGPAARPRLVEWLEAGDAHRDAGRYDEAELAYRGVLRLVPEHLRARVGLGEVARLAGDTEAAIGHYQIASALQPRNLGLHAVLRDLLIDQERFDWRADIAKALSILEHHDSQPAERLAACQLLVQYGVTQGLERELAPLAADSSLAGLLLRVVRQLERSGLARPLPDASVPGDSELDELVLSAGITERPVPGAQTLVLVFGGANHRLGLAFDIIHRVLRPAGVSAIYLRDLDRSWYMGGIVGLGSGFDAAAAALREKAARSGAKRVLAIASCIGCYGALRYGAAAGIEAILGLSPRLRLPAAQWSDLQARLDRLTRLSGSHPALASDVRESYLAAPNRPSLHLVYGEDCAEDAGDARYLAGIQGVTTAGIAGYAAHGALNVLVGRGLLSRLLLGFVRDAAIEPALLAEIRAPDGPAPAAAPAG